MDKFEQPEREVCRQGLPAVVIASAGLALVGLLSLWVLKVAAGTIAISEFRNIVFVGHFVSKRTGLPFLKVFSGEEANVIVTTIPGGPGENPRYRPQIGKAEWALRRHSWNAEWLYDVALAYWQEALRKQAELSAVGGAAPGETTAEHDRLKQKVDSYRNRALWYLGRACAQDPANGFYRRTAAELAELAEMAMFLANPTVKQNYRLMAEKHVPGSTYLLLTQADRFKKEGKTEQALQTYRRVLSHLKTEFHEELCDNEGEQLGPQYLGRTLKAFEEILKDYKGYQDYIPDDTEIHLRLATYLQDLYTSSNDEKYARAASVERSRGIESGEALIARGKHSALVLYLMAGAYEHQGDLDRCIELTNLALDLRPHTKSWLMGLAERQLAVAEKTRIQADSQLAAAQEAQTQAARAQTDGMADIASDLQRKAKQYLTLASELQRKARQYLSDADESLMRLLTLDFANEQALELRRTVREKRVKLSE